MNDDYHGFIVYWQSLQTHVSARQRHSQKPGMYILAHEWYSPGLISVVKKLKDGLNFNAKLGALEKASILFLVQAD